MIIDNKLLWKSTIVVAVLLVLILPVRAIFQAHSPEAEEDKKDSVGVVLPVFDKFYDVYRAEADERDTVKALALLRELADTIDARQHERANEESAFLLAEQGKYDHALGMLDDENRYHGIRSYVLLRKGDVHVAIDEYLEAYRCPTDSLNTESEALVTFYDAPQADPDYALKRLLSLEEKGGYPRLDEAKVFILYLLGQYEQAITLADSPEVRNNSMIQQYIIDKYRTKAVEKIEETRTEYVSIF